MKINFFQRLFRKSQLDMFGGAPPAQKKTTGLNFEKPKTEKEARIGDLKSENGKYYIFLETTIGKPRWHTHAELLQMAKDGKPIPEIAKKKIPSLAKVKEEKNPNTGMTNTNLQQGYKNAAEKWEWAMKDINPETGKPRLKGMTVDEYEKYVPPNPNEKKAEEKKETKEEKPDPLSQAVTKKVQAEKEKSVDEILKEDLAKANANAKEKIHTNVRNKAKKMLEAKEITQAKYDDIVSKYPEGAEKEKEKEEKKAEKEKPAEAANKPFETNEVGNNFYNASDLKFEDTEVEIAEPHPVNRPSGRGEGKLYDEITVSTKAKKFSPILKMDIPWSVKIIDRGNNSYAVHDSMSNSVLEAKTYDDAVKLSKTILAIYQRDPNAVLSKDHGSNKEYDFSDVKTPAVSEKEYKFTTTDEFLKSKGLTKDSAKKLPAEQKGELSKEYEQLQDKESKQAQDEFKQKSIEEKEQRRLEQEKNNKQFEDQLQMDEKDMNIEDRIDAKINDKRPLTPEEQKYFDENQYAPTGFKYDSQGNLIKQESNKSVDAPKLAGSLGSALSDAVEQTFGIKGQIDRAIKEGKSIEAISAELDKQEAKVKKQEELLRKEGTGTNAYQNIKKIIEKDIPEAREYIKSKSEPEHKVGDTKQEDGHTYRLNENHRWERVDEDKKEPHQMTKAELTRDNFYKEAQEEFTKEKGLTNDEIFTKSSQKDEFKTQEGRDKFQKEFEKFSIEKHKKLVEKALSEGKVVPDEVLKEYPDLAEKIKTENQFDAKALRDKLLSLKPKLKFLNADERKAMEKLAERTSSAKNSQEKLEVAKDIDAFLTAVDKNIEDKAQRDRMVNPTAHASKEDIHKIVEQKLDEKQENKSFKDIGKRVGGSKKEIAAIRAITSTDLDNMDNATAYKVVTKDRILPDIDVEQRRLDGEDAGLVFLKKKLHEAVSAKPANNPEARKAYVEMVPKLFEKIDAAKSIDEIDDIGRNTFERLYSYRGGNKIFLIGSKDTVVEDYLGKTFLNLITKNTDSATENWSKAILYDAFPENLSKEKHEKYIEARTNNIKETKERLAARTPEEWERETKDDYMVKYTFNGNQLNKMKKEEPDKYAKLIQDHKDRVYKKLDNSLLSFENWIKDRPRYAPRPSDWSWTGKKERQVTQTAQKEMKIHDNPPLDYIKRVNGREVKNSDITPEAIKEKLGFNSVQFGNYVKDNEAKEHVKHFISAIYDLEDALGIDMTKINKMGNLSMSFGARGSGKAGAHYESMSKIVNLTKSNGDGAVAHELHHYFDHLFGGMKDTGGRDNMFLSHYKNPSTPIGQAMRKVMDAIYQGDYEEEKSFEPTSKYSYGSIKRAYEQKGFDGAIAEIKRYPFKEDYYKYLAKLEGKPISIPIKTNTTRFNKNAQNFKSDYWSRPLELFARATESFIQDKLEEKGMYNNYLVSGNDVTKPDGKWDATSLGLTYPQGEERKKINSAIDELWKVAIKELNIGQDKPKEGKRITSEVKIEKSFGTTIHIFNLSKRFTFNGR